MQTAVAIQSLKDQVKPVEVADELLRKVLITAIMELDSFKINIKIKNKAVDS